MFSMMIISIIIVYFSSIYLKNVTINNLLKDDTKKTSELTFEILYTKMQEGWSREDLSPIINRLNNLRPGLEVHTYRSKSVEELFGVASSEKEGYKDPLIQKALNGEEVSTQIKDNKIRYIRPILLKQECITCHSNSKVGDVNGVIDMTFPQSGIAEPLNNVVTNFLVAAILFIIVLFIIMQFFMSEIFINPILRFINGVKNLEENENYIDGITCVPKTYEIYMLEKTFNELSQKIYTALEKLQFKSNLLEKYKNNDYCGTYLTWIEHKANEDK